MEVKDLNQKTLNIGDTIHIVKDLKVKGMPKGIKQGTKFTIRDLTMDDESVEVKIGKSTIGLKPEYVKKC